MPNETEDYNNFVRANLPAGMSYSANRYRYNNHSFYVFELAAWYYYYLLRVNSPSNLFSANEQGVWYDPSDLTTLFQDSAGTTPVTAAGQPVGLMLDKSKEAVFAPRRNLYKDSQNLASASWITNRATTTAAGTISTPRGNLPYFKMTTTGIDSQLTQSVDTGPIAGKTYTLSFVAWTDAGQPTDAALFFFGGNTTEQVKQLNMTLTTTPTLYTLTGSFTGGATNTIVTARIDGSETQGGYIYATAAQLEPGSSVTAYQETTTYPVSWLGNHATQATAAQRPTYGIHPYSGLRNLAISSADMANNTMWPTAATQNGITATKTIVTRNDGMPAARYRFQGTATSTFTGGNIYSSTFSRVPVTAGQVMTASCIARVVSGSLAGVQGLRVQVSEDDAAGVFIGDTKSGFFTDSTDTVLTVSRTQTTGTQMRPALQLGVVSGAVIDVTFEIAAFQFELGSTRTAYQANFNRFNITEAGVPSVHYIGFDGVDDGMVTSAIDFSATDAVTVFAGVRKLSDAARAVVVELGNAISAGLFRIQAPNTSLSNYDFAAGGTIPQTLVSTSNPPVSVVTGIADISGDLAALRLNGAQQVQNTSDQGTGNYSSAPLYIGRRGGSSLPFNGNIYSLIVRGAQSTASQITNTETWVNGKTGAY